MPGTQAPRGLLLGLRAGAVYDTVLGLFILSLGRKVMASLGHDLPEPYFYLLAAMPLFLLPAVYWSAATAGAPLAFRTPVLWARFAGGLYIVVLTAALRPPGGWIFFSIAVLDFVWGAVHALAWRRMAD